MSARAIELENQPVASTHAWVAENLVMEVDPKPDGFCAIQRFVDDALRIGLRHVGRKTEGAVGGKIFVSDVFVDPSARLFVTVRHRDNEGDVGSKYFVMTIFDDAATLMTSSLAKAVMPSSERLEVRSGTGDLEKDVASHLAALDAKGPAPSPLPVRDHEDVARLLRIYYRHSISADVAASMQWATEMHAKFLAGKQ